MRQLLGSGQGVSLVRVPAPRPGRGQVLVRLRYSLVSMGTELASLRPTPNPLVQGSLWERGRAAGELARAYLAQAVREPRRAVRFAAGLVGRRLRQMVPRRRPSAGVVSCGQLQWQACEARELQVGEDGALEVATNQAPATYQVMSRPVAVPAGRVVHLELEGRVEEGGVAIGLLDQQGQWLGSRTYGPGPLRDRQIHDPGDSPTVTVVIANAEAGASRLCLESVRLELHPRPRDGLPANEMEQQGWSLGYSAAGEVVAVGEGVEDLAPGMVVACAGAGWASHAEYVCVPRNLVCPVPRGCPAKWAATATVGAIALQGVRRAEPRLGERAAVLGLGLLGQITVQLLRASGCQVLGLDPQASRVERARDYGLAAGSSDPEEFRRLVRDLTGGHGVDFTVVTAATPSSEVTNLALALTRRKGKVVLVGEVGLELERPEFYRKELDLLMSTSYGPGRYDRRYEELGQDYPFAYVRWTLNRNLEAYLELVAQGQVRPEGFVDRVVPWSEAPRLYQELASGQGERPVGVLLVYAVEEEGAGDDLPAPVVHLRGARRAARGVISYALVGVGAFGTSMLVPQLSRLGGRFFLRAVVSRDPVRGGNYARSQGVEVVASDLEPILNDPQIRMVLIATRHHRHARQVVRCLRAGKHVFVEKPLALTWEELEEVVRTYQELAEPPLLMVGFNRRFAPAVQELSRYLAGRRSPLVINYRLAAGYLPPDHWVQDERGGGRNLGEACHIYDLFRCLAGAPPATLGAAAIDPGGLPYLRNDNFCASLTYQDGSLATLTYTALGPSQGLGKERMEVFCDGECYVLDDYRRLLRASDGRVLWEAEQADKGHGAEMAAWARALSGEAPAPIPFAELVETSAVALELEDVLKGRS